MVKSWRFVAFRDKQCSRPTCHRAAQALLGPVASLVARFDGVFGADWPAWAPGAACACLARVERRVTGEQVCLRTTRWHAATSEGESRMAGGACSSLAVEWPDPERAVAIRSQSDGCACVHETGWLWPLRIAKRMHEWATSGAERRNTAAYGHAISLGAFRTVLGVGVDEAGSISWRSCTRRLVDLAARRLVGPSAHRPSGRGPGSGFALERRIAPPSRAGGLMPRRG